MTDPRKKVCIENNHLYDLISIDCDECTEKKECWKYSGFLLGFISEESLKETED